MLQKFVPAIAFFCPWNAYGSAKLCWNKLNLRRRHNYQCLQDCRFKEKKIPKIISLCFGCRGPLHPCGSLVRNLWNEKFASKKPVSCQMRRTSQVTAAVNWSYLLPKRLEQCQKTRHKLIPQWISQSIILINSCHKSYLQGNPPHRTWTWQPGAGGELSGHSWQQKLLVGCG